MQRYGSGDNLQSWYAWDSYFRTVPPKVGIDTILDDLLKFKRDFGSHCDTMTANVPFDIFSDQWLTAVRIFASNQPTRGDQSELVLHILIGRQSP